ncbi:hypothetical protein [Rheinheimera oceanensis]|uniref:hypothetical protein n=2 Tax=Rheinheimera oceanensis TaxID=2817449 RepID=UPI001C05F216|nr:hypothetical protein [Rheinheimera oceanensis]
MRRLLCLFLSLISPALLAYEPASLCSADEQVIFACEVKHKLLSVCASADVSHTSGYMQYRFGQPDKIELTYPATKVAPQGRFFLSSAGFSGGGANIIRFNNSGYEYLVFDLMRRTNFTPGEPHDAEFHAGIVTRRHGKITSTRSCDNNNASIRAVAFDVLETEEFDYNVIP